MSENMVLKILEVIQDQLRLVRDEAAENKAEVLARIDQTTARIEKRITTLDLAWRMEGARRHAELEDRIQSLEAEVEALKAAAK